MLLMIDNYDSFTFNLAQYLGELGADVHVHRNDAITLDQIAAWAPEKIVISPGPCTPNEAGISLDLVGACAKAGLPLLGVCLGHQSIGQHFGGTVQRGGFLQLLQMLVLDLEGLDAEQDIELRVDWGGSFTEVPQEAHDALARGLRDFVVTAPLADHVGTGEVHQDDRYLLFGKGKRY